MNRKIIDRKDLKVGDIIFKKYNDGTEFICRIKNIDIYLISDYICAIHQYFAINCIIDSLADNSTLYQPTIEEKDWIEYCELHGQYFEKEYALHQSETRLLREFVEQYLTEE